MADSSFIKDDFMNLIEGDKDLFKNLLELFEQDSPDVFSKLEAAIEAGDKKTAEQLAHRLKGNLRNFYAEEAANVALKIEGAARENRLNEVVGDLSTLKTLMDAFLVDIKVFYESL